MLLLPQPANLKKTGGFFRFSGSTPIILGPGCNSGDLEAALLLKCEIEKAASVKAIITKSLSRDDKNSIHLIIKEGLLQSYQIFIQPDSIEVKGADSAGLFYGVQTLRQLLRLYSLDLPCLEVDDYPTFENRGYFYDVTRGKVPTLDTLKDLADRLSFYKINQLQLYVEHSFAFKKQREIWTGNDPLTSEDILLLDEYCKKRHIELVPSLSTFGHLYHALVSKSYRSLCEIELEGDVPFSWIDRMMHYTLDVSNTQSIEFVKAMLDEYIPLFSSGKINICCDETFDLGMGKSAALAEKVGKERLYIDFLKQIIAHVKTYGKQVMMWGDIIVDHPELIIELPGNAICLNWNYEAAVKEDSTRAFYEAGMEQYVCPGVGQWNTLAGNLDEAFENISRMIGYGKKYSASGVLNTDWGDFGHINFLSASMTGMIFGAALSWNYSDTADKIKEIDSSISLLEFGDASGQLVELLRKLGHCSVIDWKNIVGWLEQKQRGKIEKHWSTDSLVESKVECIRAGYAYAVEIEHDIMKISLTANGDRRINYEELVLSARGVALFQALGIIMKKQDYLQEIGEYIIAPGELAEHLECWYAEFSGLWRQRNRESELYRIREAFQWICKILRSYEKNC